MSIEMITPSSAAQITGGSWNKGEPESWPRLQFDSRKLEAGEMFIALQGERDGHDFVEAAKNAGAVAVLVEKKMDVDLPQLVVEDSLAALHKLAAHQRSGYEGEVVMVTGSNGKSTTKEMIASILRDWSGDDRVFASAGNRNNQIGLPLSLLDLRDEYEYAVFEAGMNFAGEITTLAELAKPGFGVITNAGSAHLGNFNGVEDIARAKGELIPAVAENGIVVLNADDKYFALWQSMAEGRSVMAFSHEASPAAVCRRLSDREFVFMFDGCTEPVELTLQLPGIHNECNAMAAATTAWCMGAPKSCMRRGLEGFAGVSGRLQFFMLHEMTLIDDSYNASPESFEAALDMLASRSEARKVLVMGDMLELGPQSRQFHMQTLRSAKERGISMVLGFGEETGAAMADADDGVEHFGSKDELIERICSLPAKATALLVKGSREMKMEEVVQALLNR